MRERLQDILRQVDDFFTVEGLKRNWDIISIFVIFVLAVWLRYLPADGMQYLQALDPYLGFRLSQHLAYEGSLPALDFMRYFPYAFPVYTEHIGAILFPAVFYWMGPFLFFENYLAWAQFYPALMGGLSVVFAYLFSKEVWNKTAGVSGAFFLATIAGVMQRTSAGWFIKESAGVMFMMMSLYFFVRAWKRNEWLPGIISGLALAGFTITWGGSKMLWLLYPLTVGTVMLLDEDTERLMKAYTPTIIIGGGIAATLQPSRFWFTGHLFMANIALVGFLWSRKLVEELQILEDNQLKYYTPGTLIFGLLAVALSPLYSNFIARQVSRLMTDVLAAGGGATIAGTVAENQAPSLGQLVSQFGALPAAQINPLLGNLSHVTGPWPLAFLAVAFMGTTIAFMILRKYGMVENVIDDSAYYSGFGVVLLAWIIGFAIFFQENVLFAIIPAILMALVGIIFVHSFDGYGKHEIEFKWYYLLPFFWVLTNVLGAVNMSRLIPLASFPVAVTAGYTLSLAINKLPRFELEELFVDVNHRQVLSVALLVILVPVVAVNFASGYATVQSIGGSPNALWMESLEWMDEETEPGETILSWWDYGYHFQAIGRSPSIADGGNAGHYTSDPRTNKVNYPIADFLTSNNPENHTELFERHSADYLVLDNTMIGKYSAVSQISNLDNEEFESMIQIGNQPLRNVLSEGDDRTVATIRGRGVSIYVPLSVDEEDIEISDAPTFDVRGQRSPIDCILTDEGRKDFNVSGQTSEYCLAEDPYFSFERSLTTNVPARVVLVPKDIADVSLVRLYLMDGYDMDFVEKIPEASNDYLKVWDINKEELG